MGGESIPSGTVTFLFTDIEGSTDLLQELGDGAFEGALAEHRRLLREAFAANDGHEIGTEGDSFFVAFDRATHAVAAAVAGQLALAAHPWSHRPLCVRMGLHSGEARLLGREYIGLAVHQAARISAAAHGRQILVSHATRELVSSDLPDGAELADLGEHRMKDLREPVRIYNVTHPGLPAELPPPRTLSVLPNNLPIQLTSFIGREDEVASIGELLRSDRMLTLTGAGGSGKTRLALQVGAEVSTAFRHGVWFVELAPLTDPDLVLTEVGRALGLRPEDDRPFDDVLIDHVRRRELLVLLDNCEHLVEASARACERLLQASPNLSIIATSREPLGARGEHVHRVPSLDLPPVDDDLDVLTTCGAVRLFCDRAQRVTGTFTLTAANAPAVTDVCRRLDGLPLAIELAAARMRMFTAEEIAQRLDKRFMLLTGGHRTGLRRQQTLRAAVDWSYDLLSEPEQLLFRRLSVFAGGFTLDAADAICSGGDVGSDEVVDLLSSLVDRSLVGAESNDGRTRYRLLETMREYARELLATTDEAPDVWTRHLRWFVDLAIAGMDGLETADELEWMARLDAELDNFRQALAWSTTSGNEADGVRLAAAISPHWTGGRHAAEALRWLRATMAASPALPVHIRALGLARLSRLAIVVEDFEAGYPYAAECAGLPREQATMRSIAAGIASLGYIAFIRGELDRAVGFLEEAREMSRSIGHRFGEASYLGSLSQLSSWLGRFGQMKELAEGSLSIFRELGVPTATIGALELLAMAALQVGDLDEVEHVANEVLGLARETIDRETVDRATTAYALWDLAVVRSERGEYERARSLYEESLAIAAELESWQLVASIHRGIAATELRCGNHAAAQAAIDTAEAAWTSKTPSPPTLFHFNRAHLALVRADAEGVRRFAEELLTALKDSGAVGFIPQAEFYLAWACALDGKLDEARAVADHALVHARELGGFAQELMTLWISGRIAFEMGILEEACDRLKELLLKSSNRGYAYEFGNALEMLGWVAASSGSGERAAHLLGSAEQMRDTCGFVLLDVDRGFHDEALETTRGILGDAAFVRAWERGRTLTRAEAAVLGLEP